MLRIGLLTTANINRHLLATRGESDAYDFVAVGSRDAHRAADYAREWGLQRAHGSYEELLADADVDAVYVALPNALHHDWTLRALAAGKHVLCEKPYSRRPEQVEEAFDAAAAAGLVLTEGYMWRHNPLTRKLVELLPAIGALQGVRASFCFRLTRGEDVRLVPELGGGALLDVGCYCVSAARLLAGGEPDRVYGEAVLGPTGVDRLFTGVLRFGATTAEFTASFDADHRSLEAVGSDGTLSVADPWHSGGAELLHDGERVRVQEVSSYLCELESFAAAVRGEAEPPLGRADALGQARTLDALLRSAESGAAVTI